eukprot:CAMPEP_0178974302 /NCGR_PEP_ID=MMETSP0789-20121207/22373_1 /TAXON_ID=3005 /ORGANISM="Rhizosolenia setigera, Strain CCMP 1694" /LENGTH=33 /DNA_ID= /DNA_START= /DNA_END= /DNA_ORIENTATION=
MINNNFYGSISTLVIPNWSLVCAIVTAAATNFR